MILKMHIFLSISVAIIASADATYGGQDAAIEDFPYYVSIESLGRYICGGSTIARYWVLTTAQCASSPDLRVRAGTPWRESGGSLHEVDTVIKHENYLSSSAMYPNDIALMHVSQPFDFDSTRQPISLFDIAEKLVPGTVVNVTGLGALERLQWVGVPVIGPDLCELAYKDSYGDVPEGKLCAAYLGTRRANAVAGDEGGPLSVDLRLAGLVSWFYVSDDPDYPPVYTEVAYYRDWIDRHLEYFV